MSLEKLPNQLISKIIIDIGDVITLGNLSEVSRAFSWIIHDNFIIVESIRRSKWYWRIYRMPYILKCNKDIMTAVLNNSGWALRWVPKHLIDKEEIVIVAINNAGRSLQYASKRIRDIKPIVLSAINQDGMALLYASKRLKDDSDVVKVAIKKEGLRPVLGLFNERPSVF